MSAPLIFISHAAVDHEIALSIKRFLQEIFSDVDVFVSSDPEDLPPGDLWVEKILMALENAKLVLSLTTERGLNRKWVWFESGRTWFAGISCIPCCLGKTRKSALPAPFQSLQGMNLDEREDLDRLIKFCAKKLSITPKAADRQLMANELIRLDVRAEERQRGVEDPFSSELTQEVERTMRGFDQGTKEAIKQLLKYGELTEQTVRGLVLQSGKQTNQTMYFIGLETRTGWLIKTQSSPYPNVSRDEDRYKVSDRIRPYLVAWFERNK